MNTSTIRINWDFVSRLFLAILFLVAGVQKLTSFENFNAYLASLTGLSSGLASVVSGLVIIIEIVVAAIFVWGKWKRDEMTYILIAFTVLATILAHNNLSNPNDLMAALKNLAIVGGFIATLGAVHKRRALN